MLIMALLPGIPMLPFLVLGGGAGALALCHRQARQGRAVDRSDQGRKPRPRRRRRRRADLDRAQDRRSQDRARLRAAAAGQLAGRQRPPDRADQGAAPFARGRDGLRDAGGAHPRQRPARGQHLRHQDQGSRSRLRQDLAGPVHGHGPDRRPGEPARHCTPPSRPSACRRPGSTPRIKEEAAMQGLHRGRRRHRAVDASDRAAQDQHVGAAVLRRGARSCSRICRRNRPNWSRTSCRR